MPLINFNLPVEPLLAGLSKRRIAARGRFISERHLATHFAPWHHQKKRAACAALERPRVVADAI